MVAKVIKPIVFFVLAGAMVVALSNLVTPSFEPQRSTIRGIYKVPQDSVQVVALGASTILDAFSPVELYEKYGISSYNCGAYNESVLTSRYLLDEMMRLHGDSLSVVVLDVTPLVAAEAEVHESQQSERVGVFMEPSRVKLDFANKMTDTYEGVNLLEQMVPLLKFHGRWNELKIDDFRDLLGLTYKVNYSHGQNIIYRANAIDGDLGKYTTEQNVGITESIDYGEDELRELWDQEMVSYLDEMLALCDEWNLDLLLIKTPRMQWDDKQHDSASLLAEERGVPFVDLTLPEIWSECGLSYDLDYMDSKHTNVLGSKKISDWLGRYLCDNYDLDDVRNADVDPFEGDLEEFHTAVESAMFPQSDNLSDYLDLLGGSTHDTFITVKGEAAEGLTDEVRSKMQSCGLRRLSKLQSGQSYVGIIHCGQVLVEKVESDGKELDLVGSYDGNDIILARSNMQENAQLDNMLELISAGKGDGSPSQIVVLGKNRALGKQGLNFVVYDNKRGGLIDASAFASQGDMKRVVP